MQRGFVSDNCAGAHPDILRAISQCNAGHAPSYGEDACTKNAKAAFSRLFGRDVPVSFVFNGTGANVLSLACALRPFESVICADCAHINADETGAPERVLGSKLQAVPSGDGKITAADIAPLLSAKGSPHHSQPRVVSLTNVTEWGAVYTPAEVRALCDFAHANGLLVHMDGARIANAAVACGVDIADLTLHAGLDVLSFGGVKNGLLFGEAVVFFNEPLADAAPYMRKNVTQLQSKMRYIGAQYEALLANDLWRKNAAHANEMAGRLEAALRTVDGIEIVHGAAANMLFVSMPDAMQRAVHDAGYGIAMGDIVRMVAAWDTQQEDIDGLMAVLADM